MCMPLIAVQRSTRWPSLNNQLHTTQAQRAGWPPQCIGVNCYVSTQAPTHATIKFSNRVVLLRIPQSAKLARCLPTAFLSMHACRCQVHATITPPVVSTLGGDPRHALITHIIIKGASTQHAANTAHLLASSLESVSIT
jgi:hypothetical protein